VLGKTLELFGSENVLVTEPLQTENLTHKYTLMEG